MKLYHLAYACRLYQGEFDNPYRRMRSDLGDSPTMDRPEVLIEFLNKWGCRIPARHHADIQRGLRDWANDWICRLPDAARDILSLTEYEVELVGQSFRPVVKTAFWGNVCGEGSACTSMSCTTSLGCLHQGKASARKAARRYSWGSLLPFSLPSS